MDNKRFIAGASCPACGQQDKIYTYREDGAQWRACASCDFCERFDEGVAASSAELSTRVNQPRLGEQPLAHEVEVVAVRLVDIPSAADTADRKK